MSAVAQLEKIEAVKTEKHSASKTPQVLERYELKYTIPLDMVEPMCRFIEPYCSLDEYSEKSSDRYYIVNSLYFDTPNFHFFYNKDHECLERFNMRIRSLGETPQPPYFLEIKKKRRDIIKKYRAKIFETDVKKAVEVRWAHLMERSRAIRTPKMQICSDIFIFLMEQNQKCSSNTGVRLTFQIMMSMPE
jgi:hypothetical protein